MQFLTSLAAISAVVAPALAVSGKATTTRYADGTKGACGCGNDSGGFQWQLGISNSIYTAAGSQALFGDGTWCGSGCGKCYKLTSTGNAPSGQGTGGASGQSITVMVTNLCPNSGNANWCPNSGSQNDYGYSYHFDVNASDEVLGDNPIVDFEEVSCPSAASTDYDQCQCANGGS